MGARCFDVEASQFGIQDVDAAAAFIENLVGWRSRRLGFRRRPLTLRTVAQTVLPSVVCRVIGVTAPRRKAS
jgi:hypothetical protein